MEDSDPHALCEWLWFDRLQRHTPWPVEVPRQGPRDLLPPSSESHQVPPHGKGTTHHRGFGCYCGPAPEAWRGDLVDNGILVTISSQDLATSLRTPMAPNFYLHVGSVVILLLCWLAVLPFIPAVRIPLLSQLPKKGPHGKPIFTSLRKDLKRPISFFFPLLLSFSPCHPNHRALDLVKGQCWEPGISHTENIRSCPELFSLWLLQ